LPVALRDVCWSIHPGLGGLHRDQSYKALFCKIYYHNYQIDCLLMLSSSPIF
jgi:hypothetical protein